MEIRELEDELSILDSINKCVIRYAISISSEEKDELHSEWCRKCRDYLDEKIDNIHCRLRELEKDAE